MDDISISSFSDEVNALLNGAKDSVNKVTTQLLTESFGSWLELKSDASSDYNKARTN